MSIPVSLGPLSPFPEAIVVFTLVLIASVIFLIVRIKKRKQGQQVPLTAPIVLIAIFSNLLAGAAFLTYLGYGIMTSM